MIDITERKLAEEGIRQHITELEMLYQSGLALSQLLNPKEIGQKILELLEEKMDWRHTRIRLYHRRMTAWNCWTLINQAAGRERTA